MNYSKQRRWLVVALSLFGMTPAFASNYGGGRGDDDRPDLVYTMSNAAAGNSVLAFKQADDGQLIPAGSFATGGTGTGTGLGNQGALASDDDFLLVVNAGSDDISVFHRRRNQLQLVDRMPSGGIRPVSLTIDRNLVYVLNAGSDNIAGFYLLPNGKLRALSGSEQGLSGTGVAAAQIQFTRDGRGLIVTEKATNKIVTFSISPRGLPVDRKITDSPGQTPFGFALAPRRLLLVSEAFGGAANASAVSSIRINRDNSLTVVDASVGTLQSAACWVAITPDGRYAFTTNTGSNTLSTFRILRNGSLALAATTNASGAGPIDMTLSDQGEYLHVLNAGSHNISTFKVSYDGVLQAVGTVAVPVGTNGLAAF